MDNDPIQQVLERLERPVAPSAEFAGVLFARLVGEMEGERGVAVRRHWLRRLAFAAPVLALAAVVSVVVSLLLLASSRPSSALAVIEDAQLKFSEAPPFQATLSGRIPAQLISSENPQYTGPDGLYVHKVSYAGRTGWRLDVLEQSPPGLAAGSAGSFWVWDGTKLGAYKADENAFFIQPVVEGFSPLGSLSWDATGYSRDFWKDRCAESEVLPDQQVAARSSRHLRCGDLEVWVDAETGIMLKIAEAEGPQLPRPVPGPIGLSPGVVVEITSIEYNPVFSASIFNVAPPPGAKDVTGGEEVEPQTNLVAGQEAPPWSGPLLSGGTFHLEDMRGRPVLILFWADWCVPCVNSLPQFQQALRQWTGRVSFVSVDIDSDEQSARQTLQEGGYTFAVILDSFSGDLARTWGIGAIPTWVLLDAEGRVIEVRFKPQTVDQLNEMLAGATR